MQEFKLPIIVDQKDQHLGNMATKLIKHLKIRNI